MLPIVLYNGSRAWTAPLAISGLLAPEASRLEKYQPRQRYLLLDEGRTDTGSGDGLSGYLLRLEQAETLDDLRRGIKALCVRLADQKYDRLRRVFAVFLSRVVLRRTGLLHESIPELTDLQEVDNMLEESVVRWSDEILHRGIQQGHAEGMQKGLAEGRQEGLTEGRQEGSVTASRAIALRLLNLDMPVEEVAIVTGLSEETVRDLRKTQ